MTFRLTNNVIWLVVLIVTCSAAGLFWFSKERPFLEIRFLPESSSKQQYRLKVTQHGNELWYEFLENNTGVEYGQLSALESSNLKTGLREVHAWELPDELDLPDKEAQDPNNAFYAEFTIEGQHSTCHGMTRAHTPVIQLLLNDHRLGPGLWRALNWCGKELLLAHPDLRKARDPKLAP